MSASSGSVLLVGLLGEAKRRPHFHKRLRAAERI
jgi:hypothetical protein